MARKRKTPFCYLLPRLSSDEYSVLKVDIREHGVRHAIEVDEEGNVLDGHHRRSECEKSVVRQIAFELRKENAKKWTQAKVAKALGVSRECVSAWFNRTINNGTSTKANHRPDARLSLPKELRDEVIARVEKGETQQRIADDYKISQGRVSQIVQRTKREQKRESIREANATKAAATPRISAHMEAGRHATVASRPSFTSSWRVVRQGDRVSFGCGPRREDGV